MKSPTTPPSRRAMHAVRRGHLYLGLFLLPWSVLYGVTAFLFNHPTAFSDQPTATFGPATTAGTPLDGAPSPDDTAARVVDALNATQKPATPYRVAGPAKFAREFAFATAQADGQTISVLIDVKAGGGTVRAAPARTRVEPEKAPFATGRASEERAGRPRSQPAAPPPGDGIKLDQPLHERVKAAVPVILERTGFPAGAVTVTSVPDITFPIEADGRTWTASYSPMTGAVTGRPADAAPESDRSVRQFLLRLHTAHGYPGGPNARWFWAVVVDAMAGVMVFWGASGLLMWWQVKATRRAGAVVLAVSAAAATALGFAMHAAVTG